MEGRKHIDRNRIKKAFTGRKNGKSSPNEGKAVEIHEFLHLSLFLPSVLCLFFSKKKQLTDWLRIRVRVEKQTTNMEPADYQQLLTLPIPVFPPFKLRSSLIDKDPVIWEYLLADYIELFKKLLALVPYSKPRKHQNIENPPPFVLSPKTINQLHSFLQTFLHESSLESSQVFSLGAINPNIRQNQHILKLAVFSYIKSTNLVNLKLAGASVWEFCKVYVTMADKYSTQGINQALVTIPVVRKLVQGTIKSNYTTKSDDVSLIRSLQDYLGKLIASGKWKQDDSEILYLLLGQRTKKSLASDTKNNDNRKNYKNVKLASRSNDGNGLEFAESFVNKHWIEILQELYAGGKGINSKHALQIMILSLCSLTSTKLTRLLKDQLEIDSLLTLKKFNPLLSCVLLSKTFNDMNPDLKEMLRALLIKPKIMKHESVKRSDTPRSFDGNNIQGVLDMFPQLSVGQVKTLLVKNDDNVEHIINQILEMNIDDISLIEDYDQKLAERKTKKQIKKQKPKNVFEFQMDENKVFTVQMGKKEAEVDIEDADDDFRKKNLERALALLYEQDEDEPDDTYIENETISGRLSVEEDEDTVRENSKLDKKLLDIESKLFGIYSSAPDKLLRMDRNSQFRHALKKETGWTDEQIEGWARMLQKSPRRFRMLEERLVYVDGSLNKSGKKSTKWANTKNTDDDADGDRGDGRRSHDRNRHETDKRRGGKPALDPSASIVPSPVSKNNGNFKAYMDKKKKKAANKKNAERKQK